MKFKILVIGFLFLIVACRTEKKVESSLAAYIPDNASLILKINTWDGFKEGLQNNDFLKRLKSSGTFTDISELVVHLSHFRPEGASLLVFLKAPEGKQDYLYITDFYTNLIPLDSLSNKTVERYEIGDSEIQRFTLEESTFFTSRVDDKIIMSPSRSQLEKWLANFGKTEIPRALSKLYKTSDSTKTASLLWDMDHGADFWGSFLKNKPQTDISSFSDWSSLDIDLEADLIKIRGIGTMQDTTKNYLALFRHTNPLAHTIQNFAPKNAERILSYTFDNQKEFSKNKRNYLGQGSTMDSLFATVEEIGLIHLDSQKAVLLNTYGSENVAEFLTNIQRGTSDFNGAEILELGQGDFLEESFAPLVKDFTARYATVLDNAFIFSEEQELLQTVIRNYKNGSTFKDSPVYMSAMEHMASESSILYVSNSNGFESVLENHFSDAFVDDFSKSGIPPSVYAAQVVVDNDIYLTSAVAQKITRRKSTGSISKDFSISLENEIALAPQFVINHNTRAKEIIVQDMANILYLISGKGNIIWKKELEGRIQGKVHQVDLYKNGRLQLAFTTNNQFLILDRNGKEVQPFVKRFEGGNLKPLAVFDYEGKKAYRFVVVQDQKIHMYNPKGNIVTGFTYTQAEHSVLSAPKHFRIGKKDYLIFKLSDGSLKVLSRRGKVRVNVDKKIDFSENDIHVYRGKFIATDKAGVLYQIDERGKISQANLNLNVDHGMDATSKTLVLMNNNELSIKGNKIELDLGVYLSPKIFYIYDKIYIALTDIQNQRVHLFDSQAKPIPNFPISGTSLIDLEDVDNDRKLEVVVKDQDNSFIMYRMN